MEERGLSLDAPEIHLEGSGDGESDYGDSTVVMKNDNRSRILLIILEGLGCHTHIGRQSSPVLLKVTSLLSQIY